ncbi:MAG: hypothetical protein AAFO72_12685 [Pseudomonadota bacterium]
MEETRQYSTLKAAAFCLILSMAFAMTASVVRANETDSRFDDARFETGGVMVMQASETKGRVVFLWVYQSKLGQYLNKRAPSAAEVAEMQRLCKAMDRLARKELGRAFDGYGLEFADGTGDTSRLPLARRAVFFFWARNGTETCAQDPSKGRIS